MMCIGVAQVAFTLPGCHSLKDKRQKIQRLRDKILGRANVSLAEVGAQNLYQKGVIGYACVSSSQHGLKKTMQLVRSIVEQDPELVILEYVEDLI